ncbi:hypothetical protein BGZ99_008793 [Dissophora globulifera]|uniref:Uncharacterized protein n=1 Tax=Dissophora globulifera TaxID=979702 RepID=A0A9P6RUS5_9FUNG|nr:hypothetical protein BGZ99_008793 [Dissophora globulifera]
MSAIPEPTAEIQNVDIEEQEQGQDQDPEQQEQDQEPDLESDLETSDVVPKLEIASLTTTRAAVGPADLEKELQSVKERLEAIAKEERTGADAEKVALEELGKATEALIAARKQLSEKQAQLDALDDSDSSRSTVQSELDQLIKEADDKEHQWSATKEVCHREFGPITDNSSAPVTEAKVRAEHDIKLLQDQIANLQKQLDAVSIRRKLMAADAEEQHRKLAERGDALEDEDEIDV